MPDPDPGQQGSDAAAQSASRTAEFGQGVSPDGSDNVSTMDQTGAYSPGAAMAAIPNRQATPYDRFSGGVLSAGPNTLSATGVNMDAANHPNRWADGSFHSGSLGNSSIEQNPMGPDAVRQVNTQ